MDKKASELFRLKDYTGALNAYSTLLSHRPDSAALFVNRAACLLELKKWTEARDDCEKALKLDPKYEKARFRYAQVLIKYGELDQATKQLLQCDPENESTMDLMCQIPLIKMRIADKKWANARQHCPRSVEITKNLADTLVEYKQWDQALDLYNEIWRWHGVDKEPMRHNRGLCYLQTGSIRAAIGHFNICNCNDSVHKLVQQVDNMLDELAQPRSDREQLKLYNKCLDLLKSDYAALAAYLLVDRAGVHARLGDHHPVIADCTEAMKAYAPSGTYAYAKRARAYYALKQFKKAVDDFQSALKLHPKDAALKADHIRCVADMMADEERKQREEFQKQERRKKRERKRSPSPEPDQPKNFDPYKILGVKSTATLQQIKTAYRVKALHQHPDKVIGDASAKKAAEERFKEINRAYELLCKRHADRRESSR
jgi:tetratricopeptide (TPR) repeat protein